MLTPTTTTTAIPTTTMAGLTCITGRLNLFTFIVAPRPGDIIGTLTLTTGTQVLLIQTRATTPPLSAFDGRNVTVCGRFVRVSGQTAFDVQLIPTPAPTPTPTPIDIRLLILLLIILLLQLGVAGGNITTIRSLVSNPATLQSLISNPSVVGQLQGLAGRLQAQGIDLSTLLSQATAAGLV